MPLPRSSPDNDTWEAKHFNAAVGGFSVKLLTSLVSLLFVVTLDASVKSERLAPSQAIAVELRGLDIEPGLRTIVGAGISVPAGTSTPATSAGRGLVWKLLRDDRTKQGDLVVAYAQYVVDPAIGEARLRGAELIVELSAGEVTRIHGRQYTSFPPSVVPTFARSEAQGRAIEALSKRSGLSVRPLDTLSPRQRIARDSKVELQLVPTAFGMRYAYLTHADIETVPYTVIIDAENASILALTRSDRPSNCYPSPYSSHMADGHPVRSAAGISNRTGQLKANTATNRPSGYDREGFAQGSPHISVLQETTDSNFMCYPYAPPYNAAYTLFPVTKLNGVPTYTTDGSWQGRMAGDAQFHTRRAMDVLSWLGRSSWDGAGADANITVQSTRSTSDNAVFVPDDLGDPRLPEGASVAVTEAVNLFSQAAALDVVAHEWGHGVVATSAGWDPLDNGTGEQLHEGFADVFGHMTEQYHHGLNNNTSGCEMADWNYGEDARSTGASTTCVDDCSNPTANARSAACSYGSGNFHRLDTSGSAEHDIGNVLAVAYRLMDVGGQNPICADGFTTNCDVYVSPIGSNAAFIMYGALLRSSSADGWQQVANNAMYEAQSGQNCYYGPDRHAEQEAVRDAFTAVGWAPAVSVQYCN
jgi:hypothetical protein